MAFQQGLSGLASSSKALDVISNNVANASTAGFKQSSVVFADVYASALTGAVSTIQIGIGSTVNAVRQAFTQGNITTTNNPLDMALNGNGFFVIARNDGTTAYSRNGQFDVDNQGYIITPLNERLVGYQRDEATGLIPASGGSIGPLLIPQNEIQPRATTDVEIAGANLNADDVNPANRVPPGPGTFSQTDPDSYNATTSIDVFDSLGQKHALSLYWVRTTATANNEWTVYASLDGDPATQLIDSATNAPGTLQFSNLGLLSSGTSNFTFERTLTTGAADLSMNIDLDKMTQFGSPFSVTDVSQDGFTSGQIAGIAISQAGIIQGRYTNGQTQDLGQVALVTFRSPNGLTSLGNNLWAASPDSGPAVLGRPGTGLNGVISAGQIEESNVDLTQELVQMIIQQRNYQANAQSIKAQDQILQTLVNLR